MSLFSYLVLSIRMSYFQSGSYLNKLGSFNMCNHPYPLSESFLAACMQVCLPAGKHLQEFMIGYQITNGIRCTRSKDLC